MIDEAIRRVVKVINELENEVSRINLIRKEMATLHLQFLAMKSRLDEDKFKKGKIIK